jgi:hypothetical protein
VRRRADRAPEGPAWTRARTGLVLLLSAAALYLGAEALALVLLLGAPYGLLALPAVLGLMHWLVAAAGLGLVATGPGAHGARGLAAGTLAAAAVHLLLAAAALWPHDHGPGLGTWWDWPALVSSLDALFYLGGIPRLPSQGWLPLLAGLAELARLILWALTLRALALAFRARRAASHALLLLGAAGVVTVLMVVIDLALGGLARAALRSAVEGGGGGLGLVRAADTLGSVLNSVAVLALLGGNLFVVFEV